MKAVVNLIDWLGRPGLAAVCLLLLSAYGYVLYSIIKEVYSWITPRKS